MKPVTVTLERFAPMYGWRNRILRVDLSAGRIWAQEAAPDVPAFLGARGLAAKIVWDEYPEPVDAFDPRNPFMVMPGALTGTRSPYSGRTNVCGFGPQGLSLYLVHARLASGLDWGSELKKAGYDGLVVTGASETPVQILIRDDEVSILARGRTCGASIPSRRKRPPRPPLASMPRRSPWVLRVSACRASPPCRRARPPWPGRAGFGSVMGSKKLKAVSVIGSERVPVADPDRVQYLFRAVGDEVRGSRQRGKRMESLNKQLEQQGGGKARVYACTDSCPTPCSLYLSGVQGCGFDRKWTGGLACVSGLFGGGGRSWLFDYNLGFRGGFELNMVANRLGLNHWDLLVGMVPWMRACDKWGCSRRSTGVPWTGTPWTGGSPGCAT